MITVNPSSFYIDLTNVPIGVFVSLSSVDTSTPIAKHTWHFDDGAVAYGATTQHAYTQPGIYDVKHVACDYTNRSYVTVQTVTAYTPYYDAVTLSFQSSLTAGIASTVKISVTSTQPPPHNVTVHLENSNSLPARYPIQFFDHLLPYWGVYATDDTQFIHPINSIEIPTSAITINNQVTAAWCGSVCVSIVDHMPGTPTVWATVQQNRNDVSINSRAYAASSIPINALVANATSTYVNITHDGLSAFAPTQYAGINMPIIVTINDRRLSWPYIVHYINQYGTASLTLTSAISSDDLGQYSFQAVQQCLSSTPYYKTTITTCTTGTCVLSGTAIVHINSTPLTAVGCTPTFGIKHLYDYNAFRLINENFDFTQALKGAMPSSIVSKSSKMFDEYYPAIFGDPRYDSEQSYGIKLLERISNFTANHGDVDTCGFESLYSKGVAMGVNIDNSALVMPDEIKRIIDVASVGPQRLWGTKCGCNMTFDACNSCCDDGLKCTLCKQQKVMNRGELIDTTTYMVTAGVPIVVCPVQTKDFELLYTIPVSGSNTYPISAINYTNLTSPLSSNYSFYHYIDTPANNTIENMIDWSNCRTLLQQSSSQKQWLENGGTVEQIIDYLMITNLQLAKQQCSTPTVTCQTSECA